MKIIEALNTTENRLSGQGITSARWDAELLLAHALRKDRTWIFTHVHDSLDPAAETLYQQLIDRRARREPLQYIVGTQEFWGLEFAVTAEVLIPRPETELVVESALASLKGIPQPLIIDVCTGSGCIAISLANELSASRIFATDSSEPALAVARENARKHEVSRKIRFLEGDLFRPLDELDLLGQVHVITANPPYIESKNLGSLQPEVRDFEPEAALISGPKGTEIHERILTNAPRFLTRNGTLIMEMGLGQSEQLKALAEASGSFGRPDILKDLAGIDRVIKIQRK